MSSLVGRSAIPFELPDTTGRIHRLSDYAGGWLLLVFHRHLGWLPCREHLSQLRQRAGDLKRHGLQVCVITFDSPAMASAYVAETDFTWPLLLDSDRLLYAKYQMGRGGRWAIYGPASVWNYLRLLSSGRKLQRPGSDFRQMGGDVLVDPVGVIRFHFVSTSPHDRPEVAEILERAHAGE